LADQLDETNDDFNEDTFGGGAEGGIGGGAGPQSTVGKDFDFFGQTAKVSDVISEEQLVYNLKHPQSTSGPIHTINTTATERKPKKTGYEKYADPGYIPDIQPKSNLWGSSKTGSSGAAQEKPAAQSSTSAAPAKKYMSLEEVEAQMRAQSQMPIPSPASPVQPSTGPSQQYAQWSQAAEAVSHHRMPSSTQGPMSESSVDTRQFQQPIPQARAGQVPQILQRQQPISSQPAAHRSSPQPLQILQNPNRPQPAQAQISVEPARPLKPSPVPGLPQQQPIITHHQQLMHLSEEQRQAYLHEDAKRAKRNHKIYLLSKGNGLMTPQDKNFITRIQLQQLVTATGNINDPNPEAALNEDFYYQVYSQIRGAPRQHPHQPLGHFAQTYLFQTGSRTGGGGCRRYYQNGDNHMQRMQQQVQRAVEAAKLKPKNKQLIIEGSLGKISFSNAKTPKPLLNIKHPETSDGHRPSNARKTNTDLSSSDRKSVLRSVEEVYVTMMRMEDIDRQMMPLSPDADEERVLRHAEMGQKLQALNAKLWDELKVMEPIVPGSNVLHPFITFLSCAKGKKAIPRIFRHINQEQRVTILTLILVHLDVLDVIRHAQLQPGETQLPLIVREEVDLFVQAVVPSLFGYVNEAPMNIVIGLLGLVLGQTNVQGAAKTRIGLAILTMLLSRAELVKEAGSADDRDWEQWATLYNRLFDTLEPVLGSIFPGSINSSDDMYVWQFLAAVGVGASPEQQQRLVIAVK
jgi:DNA topoisomerase 2-associated protein PAT1